MFVMVKIKLRNAPCIFHSDHDTGLGPDGDDPDADHKIRNDSMWYAAAAL